MNGGIFQIFRRGRFKLNSLTFNIMRLFYGGEQGAWYDPSDRTTLYQDAAGTTPVTAMEQPVGLILDKSKGLVLGPNLVKNGDFATDSVWVKGTGWTIANGAASVSGQTATTYLSQAILTTGKTYEVIVDKYGSSLGRIQLGNTGTNYQLASGRNRFVGVCAGNNNLIATALVGDSFSIDNISVRELPGNHAFQSTSTSRPVLSARVNMLTYTEQFDNAVWTKTNSTVAATIAPDGSSTAWAIKDTASAADHFVASYVGTQLTQSWAFNLWLKAGSQRYARVHLYNGTAGVVCDTFFDLQNNGQVVSGGAGVTWTITPGNNGWIQFSGVTTTITGGANHGIYIYAANTAPHSAYLGDGSAAIYVWHPDLRPTNSGVNLPPYQRVGASTDYDTAGFPAYLKFDGIDDSLVTNSIDFTATDKMTVWAGVTKLSDAAIGNVASCGLLDSGGGFYLVAPANGATYGARSRGTVLSALTEVGGYPAPHSVVLCGVFDVAGRKADLRVGGVTTANGTDQGVGNFSLRPLAIGANPGGISSFFNGRLYGLIVRGAQTPLSQIEATELYIKQKMRMP